jgi:predicted O-linked N-acetylglucosamine transferase (SPINDLY family)
LDLNPLIQRAVAAHQQGHLDQAADLYEQVLLQQPDNVAALQLLGALRGQQGRNAEAIRLMQAALNLKHDDFGTLSNYASVLMAAGRHEDALIQLDRAMSIKPDFFEAIYNRAVTLAQLKRFAESVASYDKALSLRPNSPQILYNRGLSQAALGWWKDAVASYDRSIALHPKFAPAFDNRGNALRAMGQLEQALESYDKALALAPLDFRTLYNRAITLSDLGRFEDAAAGFQQSLVHQPQFADALLNHGIVLLRLERFAEALARFDKYLSLRPGDPEGLNNRGVALWHLGRHDEALASYNKALSVGPEHVSARLGRARLLHDMGRFNDALADYDKALATDPCDARAWNGRGAVLNAQKRGRDAIASFDKALQLKPDLADALANRAYLRWSELGDSAGAISDFQAALAADPAQPFAAGELLHLKMHVADWTDFDACAASITDEVRKGRRVVRPFAYQAICASPADLQACSRIFADSLFPKTDGPTLPARSHDKIRIGYLSGEFREQATAYLMAGLYELHDREKFEVIAIDNGGGDGSEMRRRLESAFDRILYIAKMTDDEAAALIRTAEIDILVNLNGYFGAPRMGVFARRAAPIQVNYLGFPATLGASYMDYIIADPVVIPDEEQRYYDEKTVTLPHSYQANDRKRAIAAAVPSRAAMGLPDTGFVFCNFNQSYKITPSTFAGWMRILKVVEGSVLWLLNSKPPFAENLSREAQRHGVAPDRLIFAPDVKLDRHLSRLKLADLFLDTLPYNAHTTASDALWAGVPLLTCRGTAFPGRVASSLLAAAGMPELISETPHEYEALAIRLGRDPGAIIDLKEKLARNRLTCPLFDTDLFRRHIEAAYSTMVEIAKRGEPPQAFAVGNL